MQHPSEQSSRALVTGGAGFIGSHLVDALIAQGSSVLVLDDLSSGSRENLEQALGQGAVLAQHSLEDVGEIAATIADFEPERVFHLAAQVDVRKSVADPAHDAAINLVGTINLLEALRAGRHTPSLVFASTGGAIYGEGEGRALPLPEGASTKPEAPYGASKLAAETYIALYQRLYGIPSLSLRFGNVYGPRQDPHGEAGVVAIFCGLLSAGQPLRVYGDGLQTRDYVHVGDVVDALLAADEALAKRGAGLTGSFNVGTGAETSVLELIERLTNAIAVESEIEHAPERAGEVARIAIDPDAARRELGWEARIGLDEGLGLTYSALAESSSTDSRSAKTA